MPQKLSTSTLARKPTPQESNYPPQGTPMKVPDSQKYLFWGLGFVSSGLSPGELAKANSPAILLNCSVSALFKEHTETTLAAAV